MQKPIKKTRNRRDAPSRAHERESVSATEQGARLEDSSR